MDRLRSNLEHWKEMQARGYFEKHVYYDTASGELPLFGGDVEFIERFMPLDPDLQVVVIGCGYGRESVLIAPRVGHVFGIDVSGEILEKARRFTSEHGVENFTPVLAENWRERIPEGIDLVYAITVFQHLTRDLVRDYIEGLADRLRPGGRILCQFLDESSHAERYERDAELRVYEPSVSWGPEQIEALFSCAGMRRVALEAEPKSPEATWYWAFYEKPAGERRYRVVIVKPENYVHSEAFRELAETLCHGLRRIGLLAEVTENRFDPGAVNLVLGWHLLDGAQLASLPPACILYNLEQMDERNRDLRARLATLSENAEIWDYSQRNIDILRESGFTAPIRHVPIGYAPEMSRIKPAEEQDIDVLFYGSVNPRRAAVLEALRQAGLNVPHVFGVYGEERDRLIARAKVVLNMHFYESSIFEMVRVSYLLANRKAVVAECNVETEADGDLRGAARLVPYGQLVSTCLRLVETPEERRELESQALEAMLRRDETRILREAILSDSIHGRTTQAPEVSVVVLTRNRPVFLRRALASIQQQTFTDFEVLVVNDAGEDVSALVSTFRAEGMTITLLNQPEQRGQSAGRNLGIRASRGRWITYLDDDDLYYPDHLETLVATLRRSGAKVAYTDSMRAIEEEREGEWVVLGRELAMSNDFDRERFLVDNLTPVNNVMHEKACWEVCGPHDETLPVLEDWDYWIRLSRKWDFVHIPKATAEVRWRKSGANITFEKQDLFPPCRLRIAAKVRALLAEEAAAGAREAFLHEPRWNDAEWVEVLLSFLAAFLPGEPVALVLLMDPDAEGQIPLEDAQARILELVARSGRESFPDVVLVDKPSELLETLRPFARFQWVPQGRGRVEGLEGTNGLRLARARSQMAGGNR